MHVLVPLDGSEASRDAMLNGLKLLKACKPKVTLLCACAPGFDQVDDDRREMFEEDSDDEIFASETEASAMLNNAAKACKKLGVTAVTKVVEGSYVQVILDESQNVDMVLMHHLTKETIKEKLRMSNSESLVRSIECAVLLA